MKIIFAMALTCVVAMSAPASADESNEATSRDLFTNAAKAYDSGDREEALRLYRESYALVPRAKTLLNIGVVLSELGKDIEAANTLAQYIADPDADRQRVLQVRPLLAELDSKLLRLRLNLRGPSPISVNSKTFEGNEVSQVLRVYPGKHIVTVGSRQENIEGAAGAIVSLNMDVPMDERNVDTPPPPPVTEKKSILSHPALWTGAVSLVAAGVGTGFAFSFRSAQSELEDVNNNSEDFRFQEALDLEAKAKSRARVANIAFGVAGVAAITTVALVFLIDRDSQDGETETLRLGGQVGPGSAGINVFGRF